MNMHWDSTKYSIKDILDFEEKRGLELRPDFQRRSVWTQAAKIMLIDSILQNIPMPKFYVHIKKNSKGKEIKSIIDGQQRIRAILEFIANEFILSEPYKGEYINYSYKDFIDHHLEHMILDYKVDINEIHTDSEKIVREIYSRVNKYTVALNTQELRRADFPGDFLAVSEHLSTLEYFDEAKIFTTANRRRMTDVEYISELLAALLKGPQDKKETLDSFYISFTKWTKNHKESTIQRFQSVLKDLQTIFSVGNTLRPIKDTRFRQKADFYCLFVAVDELQQSGFSLEGKELGPLREDFGCLDYNIAPESEIEEFSKYAIRCTSQANTIGSRTWRKDFLKRFLGGTYIAKYPDDETIKSIHFIMWDLYTAGCEYGCPPCVEECPICNEELDKFSEDNARLIWLDSSNTYQLSNARFAHKRCFEKQGLHDYMLTTSSTGDDE